jgi:hypothetical protein
MRPILVQSIYINLMPSKLILGVIFSVSIAACVILLYLPIYSGIKLAIIALILASSTYYILRDALLHLPWSWQALEVNSKGQLKIVNLGGTEFQPVLGASSFVHPNLIILNFRSIGFWCTLPPVILLTSAQNADELRRLRVWLRWFRRDEIKDQDDLSGAGLDA